MTKSRFDPPNVNQGEHEEAALPYPAERQSSAVTSLKEKHEKRLMSLDGVEGVGIGQDEIGNEAIVVYVRDQGVVNRIPRELDGVQVRTIVTGPVEALKPK